jgi:hypothetical protein
MVLADSHGYAHGGGEMALWPLLLILGLLALIVLVVVLVVLSRRNSQQPGDRWHVAGDQPTAPPGAPASTSQVPGQPQPSRGDPVQQAARMGDYLYCEDTILDVLRQKGRPMTQKEVCEDTGLTEQEVAGALAFMEERCMVKRTWDSGHSTYIVEAT